MYNDKLITLYIDLCDDKVKKDIRSIIDDMREVSSLSSQPTITSIRHAIKPDIYKVYAKMSDYKEEIDRNANMFYKKRRNKIVYHITKVVIRIRYFFWIIWWYIKK